MATPVTASQFGRFLRLSLNSSQSTFDLSKFRVRFEVRQSDSGTPNTAAIRVYNLSDTTIQEIAKTATQVILEAGYENGNRGVIFVGDVKHYVHGKENNVDRFLDIFAGDGDTLWISATVNTQAPANVPIPKYESIIQDQVGTTLNTQGVTNKSLAPFGGVLPRGRVLHGMARDYLHAYSKTQNCRWYVKDGQIQFVPNYSYVPSGSLIDLNGNSGLVGYPEATEEGIMFTCLLNPNMQIGTRVQLDNKSIITTDQIAQGYPSYSSVNYPALLAADGIYRVLVVDFVGDTRGNEWYCKCTGLALVPDKSMNFAVQVPGNGAAK